MGCIRQTTNGILGQLCLWPDVCGGHCYRDATTFRVQSCSWSEEVVQTASLCIYVHVRETRWGVQFCVGLGFAITLPDAESTSVVLAITDQSDNTPIKPRVGRCLQCCSSWEFLASPSCVVRLFGARNVGAHRKIKCLRLQECFGCIPCRRQRRN